MVFGLQNCKRSDPPSGPIVSVVLAYRREFWTSPIVTSVVPARNIAPPIAIKVTGKAADF